MWRKLKGEYETPGLTINVYTRSINLYIEELEKRKLTRI